jgi:hypothetical protein
MGNRYYLGGGKMFGNNKITIPWYRRTIVATPVNELGPVTFDFNTPKSRNKPTNTPEPNLAPDAVPQPAPQPAPQPNPSTNPSPDNSPKINPKVIPVKIPTFGDPQNPSNQPFPIPQLPVTTPKVKPAAKPKKAPGKRIPFPRRRPARVPAAAIDILQPWPTYETQPWEIIPVGGLVPLANNTVDNRPWYNPIIDYANEIGAFTNNVADESAVFATYLREYDYNNFSFTGMYGDLVGMYGTAAAILLMGYIVASIPLGIPGVPGI